MGEHTWIRSAEDVHTYEEGLAEDGIEAGDNVAPDYTAGMIEEAKRTGQITVYSSHQIGTGTFVTPFAMEAKSYAGDGPIYSKTISTADVAWLDSIQGQYAPVTEETTPGRASAEVTSRRALEQQLQELQNAYQAASDRNDTEFDYQGELAKIRELEQRLEGMKEEKIPHQSADSVRDDSEGENDTSSAEQSSAPSPQGEGVGDGFDASVLFGMQSGTDRAEACSFISVPARQNVG